MNVSESGCMQQFAVLVQIQPCTAMCVRSCMRVAVAMAVAVAMRGCDHVYVCECQRRVVCELQAAALCVAVTVYMQLCENVCVSKAVVCEFTLCVNAVRVFSVCAERRS